MSIDPTMFVVPAEFSCTIINENLILSNVYYIKLGIDPIESSGEKIGLGFQRIKHLVNNCLQNSIFINHKNTLTTQFENIENNVVHLPCEPYDLYIGAILMAKFIAVTEEYFDIQYLTVASAIGDHVQYSIHSPFDCELEIEGDHWWNSDTVSTGHKDVITWDELNLTPAPQFQPTVVQGGLSGNK
jgi:hypothetical protein